LKGQAQIVGTSFGSTNTKDTAECASVPTLERKRNQRLRSPYGRSWV